MKNLDLYNRIKVVPDSAKKKISGGRLSGMTDINPMWRIKMLTEEFGICGIGWKYVITDKRLEKGTNDEISAFVQIDLFIKIDSVWSDAIVGIGGASFVAKEKNGMYQSDECFKMALTDAISVACKAIGMGADVYFEKDRTKYEQLPQTQIQPQPTQKPQELTPEIEKLLSQSIAMVEQVETIEKLEAAWNNLPELHKVKLFIDSVKTAKTRLNENK